MVTAAKPTTKQQPTSEERLAALRAKISGMDLGGGQGFFTPKEGRNVIRILPAVGTMDYFFQEVGTHYNLPDSATEKCPSFTTNGAYTCPICELVEELYKAGKSYRDLAGKLRVRRQFWMNVVVREAGDRQGETGNGPLIYTPGTSVFKSVQTLVGDPDYGDISDVDDGIDLTVDRKGQGLDTEYEVLSRKHSFALSPDAEKVDEWLQEAKDLTPVMLGDDPSEDITVKGDAVVVLMPYDRILEKYGLGPGADVEELAQEEEQPSAPASNRRRGNAAPTRSARSAAKEEETVQDEVGSDIRSRLKMRQQQKR